MSAKTRFNERACSRTPLDIKAIIYAGKDNAGKSTPLRGTLLDISFGGALVITDDEKIELPVDSVLTIIPTIKDGKEKEYSYGLSAKVVRKTKEGTAVFFDEYDGDTIKAMRRIYQYVLS